MTNVLTFGSINIDDIFLLPDISKPGETVSSLQYTVLAGGKGANQSVALAKASEGSKIKIHHAGKIGQDGAWILKLMNDTGVDTKLVTVDPELHTGRAIIQVSQQTGNNSIILYPGANKSISPSDAEHILSHFPTSERTWLILQNEISCLDCIIPYAYNKKFIIVFNPAPCPPDLLSKVPIHQCHILLLNQSEAATVAQNLMKMDCTPEMDDVDAENVGRRLFDVLPNVRVIVITLGSKGAVAVYSSQGKVKSLKRPALDDVKIVDSTGAGDVFIGYFITALVGGWQGLEEELKDDLLSRALVLGTVAAGISCKVSGAMNSVPSQKVVLSRATNILQESTH